MRNQFARSLHDLALTDSTIVLLYGDSGNRLFDSFKELAPQRVINAGIAEANMVSVAAGLAMQQMKPFVYAITPFVSSRCYEQIKVDIAYPNLPVTLVGTGSGVAYANLGPTHHSFEDIAIIRALPNMQIVCPCDSLELKKLLPQIAQSKHPTYLRIGKKKEPTFLNATQNVQLGIPSQIRFGHDLLIIACGPIVQRANAVCDVLARENISTHLVSFHTIKPLNTSFLNDVAGHFKQIVVIEEHSIVGGLGSAIIEYFNDNGIMKPILRYALPDQFMDKLQTQHHGWDRAGLTTERIATDILRKVCA